MQADQELLEYRSIAKVESLWLQEGFDAPLLIKH